MTIHSTHPFADPERDDVRRFRGRLGGAVTLWTAGSPEHRAGLTVTSLMLAQGEQPHVLALLDPDSDLLSVLEQSGASVVQLLSWGDRDLAEMFAGTAPAPGGLFRQAEFVTTDWGPRLSNVTAWAGVRLESGTDVGWSRLVTCTIEHVEVGEESSPLGHRRGRFVRL
jgi:flavin reductase (DIM6/NTAB) family NADH-FMN oxidoreductase RutF